ncbi:Outer membrane porin protein 32 [Paraburkholderia caffeinitolerans]|uniref:Outer membrane porin protein 32 n=1 Tax=Paraburkholderia caffeinitolerans TaxID=1723730 RepID=A0A6J5FWK3_9BURK|nr:MULTISPECIES: porin [Paraburkholderia]CAB3788512.1 Outer membrane porin protein 32 [Paraburkholderia caffeinitolerans]
MEAARTAGWLVVAAAATVSGMAQAQGSVTLYGVVDAGFQYVSRTANAQGQNAGRTFAMTDGGAGPSVFGLRGAEDLGGGLKAIFGLESGISLANGGFNNSNGNFFGRQAWVGLTGPFGSVKAGEQFSPFFLTLFDSDPRGFSSFGSGIVPYGDNVFLTGAVNARAVSYSSPKIAGFEGSVLFAPGGVAGDFQAGRQWGASLKYDNGTVMVNAAVYDGNPDGQPTPVPTGVAFWGRTLGFAYRFQSLTVKASFVNYKVAGAFNSNVYGGGVDYTGFAQFDLNGGVWYTSDRNDTSNHSLMGAAGVNYLLSKRTTLYGQFAVVNNHGAMNTGFSVSMPQILTGVSGTTFGANLGIRHVF